VSESAKDAVAAVAPQEEIRPEVGGRTGIELRGYEIARQLGDRWVQVAHYRGDDRGFRQASKDGAYWAERYPKETYRLRPIISVPFPEALPAGADTAASEPAPEENSNGK
jgi:hypothetical protein